MKEIRKTKAQLIQELEELRNQNKTLKKSAANLRKKQESVHKACNFTDLVIQYAGEGLCVCHNIPEYPYVSFTLWNDHMKEITGYTMEEINKKGWYQTLYQDPETQSQAIERMRQMRKGDDLREEEWEITRKDGEKRMLRFNTSILETEDGVVHVLALIDDITELKKTQNALNQKVHELDMLANTAKKINTSLLLSEIREVTLDGIMSHIKPDLILLYLKQEDQLFLKGLRPDLPEYHEEHFKIHRVGVCLCGLATQDGRPLYSRDIHADPRCTLNECKEAGMKSFAAIPLILGDKILGVLGLASKSERDFSKHGSFLETLASWIAIAIQNSSLYEKVSEHSLSVEDQLRERTRKLEQAYKTLKEININLDAFAHYVSHDLRTPLRHITGFIDLLKDNASQTLDAKNRRYLNIISDSAKHMGTMMNDILSFSRISRLEMKMTAVNFDLLVKEVITELRAETEGRDIVWNIQPLPEVYGDMTMLRLVWINLIGNALKFSRTKPQAMIEIGCNENNNEIVCSIKDNGVGFDMEYVGKVFSIFQRLHSPEEFEGMGVGLTNVQRIIQRHGGRIWAKGKEDEGASFYFTLPKKKNHTQQDKEK